MFSKHLNENDSLFANVCLQYSYSLYVICAACLHSATVHCFWCCTSRPVILSNSVQLCPDTVQIYAMPAISQLKTVCSGKNLRQQKSVF